MIMNGLRMKSKVKSNESEFAERCDTKMKHEVNEVQGNFERDLEAKHYNKEMIMNVLSRTRSQVQHEERRRQTFYNNAQVPPKC